MNNHLPWIQEAEREAKHATCERSRCGSVIVASGVIIGRGHNSPPGSLEPQRRCTASKDEYDRKVTDKTCCVHAEQRAIIDALRNNNTPQGATLYFVRLDKNGVASVSGRPYCTICSKMALDVGIRYFVLLHESGPVSYDTEEYNTLSYAYSA